MERNQAISVAVGVGAIGTALAYLAYSHINNIEKNDLIDNLVDKSENKKHRVNNLLPNVDTNTKTENIKLEIKKDISCWGEFWKNEYVKQTDIDNNNDDDIKKD